MMSTVSEKLLQVAQNNPKVYHSGQLNIVKNAECLKEFKSDTSLLLDNVSPVKHNMGVKVHGKNLFNLSNWVSDYNVTHEVLDNGQILITGASETIKSGYTQFKQFLNAGTYTVSATMTANSTGTQQMVNVWQVKDGIIIKTLYNGDGTTGLQRTATITLTESKYYYFGLYGGTENDESVYATIQIEYGSTATEYEPYNNDIQNVYSKNLFDISKVSTKGSSLINNGDGTLTVNSYGINSIKTLQELCPHLKVNDTVILNATSDGRPFIYLTTYAKTWNFNTTLTVTQDMLDSYVVFYCGKDSDNNDIPAIISNIQIEYGSTATEYEKYHEPYPLVISQYGKNLFDISSSRGFESMYTGLTNTINGNELTVTATANRSGNLLLGTFPKGTYTINLNFSKKVDLFIQYGESISTGLTRLDSKVFNSSYTFSISETRKLWVACPSFMIDNTYIFTDIQFELGSTATDYEPYKSKIDYIPTSEGIINNVESIYPATTLLTNDPNNRVYIDCDYYKDIDKTFDELTTSVALSGGDS